MIRGVIEPKMMMKCAFNSSEATLNNLATINLCKMCKLIKKKHFEDLQVDNNNFAPFSFPYNP